MRIEARLETQKQADRRGAGRRALRLWLDLVHGSDQAANALVFNISESGLLFQTATPLVAGDGLQVDLPEAGFVSASVVWTSGEFVGCRFVRALSPAVVSAAQLRSEPPLPAESDTAIEGAVPEAFGARLRRLRKQFGLTQPALARLTNVTKLTVWKWERGDARPRHGALRALARVFAMSEGELLLGTSAHQREVEQSKELSDIVESCKKRIADHLGIAARNVDITVRL